jgi:two-component system, NtrC family, response regulator AtoC
VRILVVDDEPALRKTLSAILADEGHVVLTAADGEEALARLPEEQVDLILTDIRMPRLGGLELIRRHVADGARTLIIAMSAYGDDDTALEAMRLGAYDYIQKPFRADEVALVIRKAEEREKLRARVSALETELSTTRATEGIVGSSEKLQEVLRASLRVAPHPSTVLITGESGTGKELIARLIHRASACASGPFVAVNCGAIPETLLETELFGHVRGAFTGANAEKSGLFEEADGGTLLLDEIGELPPSLQVKLLRVLQEGEVRRVGATASRSVRVRLITATNRDLAADVEQGRFRSDLYYRVNVVAVHMPPLRERLDDIPELARHFVEMHGRRLGVSGSLIAPNAMRLMLEYAWPGNVRELENVLERALVLAPGAVIEAEHLPESVRTRQAALVPSEDLSVKRQTAALERALIQRALERTRGNRTRAAALLDLSHRALLYKIREYGLTQ